MIVTTARNQEQLQDKAKEVAQAVNGRFVPRNRYSIEELCRHYQVDQLLLVTRQGIQCVFCDNQEQPFVFHPNAAMLRIRNLLHGGNDPLQDAAGLTEGMSVLDCTLGLGADAIVASFIVGPRGQVVGIESVPVLASIVQDGLKTKETENKAVNQSMRRIKVICADHLDYLKQCQTNQYDVILFDPMFEKTIQSSTGLAPLKRLANYNDLKEEAVQQACRVARKLVVLKDSRHSSRFKRFGFTPLVRSHASFWYGIIDVESVADA
jgi:16S rRNA G966 N2-methylase RsmD